MRILVRVLWVSLVLAVGLAHGQLASAEHWLDIMPNVRPGSTRVIVLIEDVGVLDIGSPPDTVLAGLTYMVRAAVCNFGGGAGDFDVECTITPAGYIDTCAVAGLAPGSALDISFEDWTVPPDIGVPYTVCVITLLVGDENPSNDTLCKDVIAVGQVHDVGVDSITTPPDTVEPGSVHGPVGWVKNYGTQDEDFDAICQIDSSGIVVYADTISINGLMPDSSHEGVFGNWTVPDAQGVLYNTCVWTVLYWDQLPENDTLCKIIDAVTGIAEGHLPAGCRQLVLRHNQPNPFSRHTLVSYSIPSETWVTLNVYDATGRLVCRIVEGVLEPGDYSTIWRPDDLEPGVYFCRLDADGRSVTRKMVAVR